MSTIGTIARFVPEKRFGFITPDSGDHQRVFFHTDVVQSPLEEITQGARVELDVVPSAKGPRAARVIVHVDPYAA